MPPLMYFCSLPGNFSIVTLLPSCLVRPVSLVSFVPVTVESYDTTTVPSGFVIHAVPAVWIWSFRVAVIALADRRGGFTGSAPAGAAAVRARAAAATTAAVRRRDFMV